VSLRVPCALLRLSPLCPFNPCARLVNLTVGGDTAAWGQHQRRRREGGRQGGGGGAGPGPGRPGGWV